jgi:hypothetical protein
VYQRRSNIAGACGTTLPEKTSRKGRKDAKSAKEKKGVCMQAVPDKITPRLLTKTPSLPLASFAPLRLCEIKSE